MASIKKNFKKVDTNGLEVSNFAAKYASLFGKIFIGKIEDAKYSKNQFDIISSHHVIEHVPDPVSFIINIKKLIKKNGILILATPDFDSGCARLFGKKYRLLNDPTHINLFSNDSMHRFLRDNGFDIEYVEYPFFKTNYFNKASLKRLFDKTKVSPPFYGNFMTFFCRKI